MPFLAPVFAAIGTFAASSALAGFAVNLVGSLLLSAAAQALMPKPDTSQSMKGRTVSVREPVADREVVYGAVRKGGTIVFLHTTSTGTEASEGRLNEVLHMVIVLAGHEVQSIGGMYFDGALAVSADGVPQGRFAGGVGMYRALGSADQRAFPELQAQCPDKWASSVNRLRGCAAVYVQLFYTPDRFPRGIPNITFDIEGKNDILDPRTGPRVYTANAALCLADFMSSPVFGIGAQIGAADGIDEAALIAAANVCGETVAKPGGGTERRYTMNGVASMAATPETNFRAMLTSMAGTLAYMSGQWSIFAGAYRPPVVTLTADDVRDGGIAMTTRVSRADNFNGVRGQFISPENDWQPDDFPAYASSVYLAEDGGEASWRDISLPFTTSAATAQRLAKIELERGRRQLTVELSGKLSAWKLAVGDVTNLTYARWGLASKPFDVVGLTLALESDENGAVLAPRLVLRETSPLVYDATASEFQIYAAAPRTTLPSAFSVSAPGTPTATEGLYQTLSGGVKAKVTLTWPASASGFVDVYQVEMLQGGRWINQGRTDALTLEILDMAPGTYQFRVKAVTGLNVSSAWATTAAQEISGLREPPVAISGLTLQTAGGLAVLKWRLHPDLDVRVGGSILIRHSAAASPSWATSVSMDQVSGAQAIAVVPFKSGAYVLRARDSTGNLGPAVIVSTSGVQALAFALVTSLVEDTAFSGAKTLCFETGGTLRISSSSDLDSWVSFDAIADIDSEGGIAPAATYVFAAGMDLGSVQLVRLRSLINLSVLNIYDLMDARTGDLDTWLSFDGTDGSEVDAWVECRTTQTTPSGSPVWSDWSRVDSHEVQAWGVQARLQLVSYDPSFNPVISQLRLNAAQVV